MLIIQLLATFVLFLQLSSQNGFDKSDVRKALNEEDFVGSAPEVISLIVGRELGKKRDAVRRLEPPGKKGFEIGRKIGKKTGVIGRAPGRKTGVEGRAPARKFGFVGKTFDRKNTSLPFMCRLQKKNLKRCASKPIPNKRPFTSLTPRLNEPKKNNLLLNPPGFPGLQKNPIRLRNKFSNPGSRSFAEYLNNLKTTIQKKRLQAFPRFKGGNRCYQKDPDKLSLSPETPNVKTNTRDSNCSLNEPHQSINVEEDEAIEGNLHDDQFTTSLLPNKLSNSIDSNEKDLNILPSYPTISYDDQQNNLDRLYTESTGNEYNSGKINIQTTPTNHESKMITDDPFSLSQNLDTSFEIIHKLRPVITSNIENNGESTMKSVHLYTFGSAPYETTIAAGDARDVNPPMNCDSTLHDTGSNKGHMKIENMAIPPTEGINVPQIPRLQVSSGRDNGIDQEISTKTTENRGVESFLLDALLEEKPKDVKRLYISRDSASSPDTVISKNKDNSTDIVTSENSAIYPDTEIMSGSIENSPDIVTSPETVIYPDTVMMSENTANSPDVETSRNTAIYPDSAMMLENAGNSPGIVTSRNTAIYPDTVMIGSRENSPDIVTSPETVIHPDTVMMSENTANSPAVETSRNTATYPDSAMMSENAGNSPGIVTSRNTAIHPDTVMMTGKRENSPDVETSRNTATYPDSAMMSENAGNSPGIVTSRNTAIYPDTAMIGSRENSPDIVTSPETVIYPDTAMMSENTANSPDVVTSRNKYIYPDTVTMSENTANSPDIETSRNIAIYPDTAMMSGSRANSPDIVSSRNTAICRDTLIMSVNNANSTDIVTSRNTAIYPDTAMMSENADNSPSIVTSRNTDIYPDTAMMSENTANSPDVETTRNTAIYPDTAIMSRSRASSPDIVPSPFTDIYPDIVMMSENTANSPDVVTSRNKDIYPDTVTMSENTANSPDVKTSRNTATYPDSAMMSENAGNSPGIVTSRNPAIYPDTAMIGSRENSPDIVTSPETVTYPDTVMMSENTANSPDVVTSRNKDIYPDTVTMSENTANSPDVETSRNTATYPDSAMMSENAGNSPGIVTSRNTAIYPDTAMMTGSRENSPDEETSRNTATYPDSAMMSENAGNSPGIVTSRNPAIYPDTAMIGSRENSPDIVTSPETVIHPDTVMMSENTANSPDVVTSRNKDIYLDTVTMSGSRTNSPDIVSSRNTAICRDTLIMSVNNANSTDIVTSRNTAIYPDTAMMSENADSSPSIVTSRNTAIYPDTVMMSENTANSPDVITSRNKDIYQNTVMMSENTANSPDVETSKNTDIYPDTAMMSENTANYPDVVTFRNKDIYPDTVTMSENTANSPDVETSRNTATYPDSAMMSENAGNSPGIVTSRNTAIYPDTVMMTGSRENSPDEETSRNTATYPDSAMMSENAGNSPGIVTSRNPAIYPETAMIGSRENSPDIVTSPETVIHPDTVMMSENTANSPDVVTSRNKDIYLDTVTMSESRENSPDIVSSRNTAICRDTLIMSVNNANSTDIVTSRNTAIYPDTAMMSENADSSPSIVTSRNTAIYPDTVMMSEITANSPDVITSRNKDIYQNTVMMSENTANSPDVETSKNTDIYPDTALMSENTANYPDVVTFRNKANYPDSIFISVNKANSTDIVTSRNTAIYPDTAMMSENAGDSPGIVTSRNTAIYPDTAMMSGSRENSPDIVTSPDIVICPDTVMMSENKVNFTDILTTRNTAIYPDAAKMSVNIANSPDTVTSTNTAIYPDTILMPENTANSPDVVTSPDTIIYPDTVLMSENIGNSPDIVTSRNTAIYPDTRLMSENTASSPDVVTSKNTAIYPDTILMSENTANSPGLLTSRNTAIYPDTVIMSENKFNFTDILTTRNTAIYPDAAKMSVNIANSPDTVTSTNTAIYPDTILMPENTANSPDVVTSPDTIIYPDTVLMSENIGNSPDIVTSRNTAIYPDTRLMSENTASSPDVVTSKNTAIYPDTILMSENTANSPDVITSRNTAIYPDTRLMSENTASSPDIVTSKNTAIYPYTIWMPENTPISPDILTSRNTAIYPDTVMMSENTANYLDTVTSTNTAIYSDTLLVSENAANSPNIVTSRNTAIYPDTILMSENTTNSPDIVTSRNTAIHPDNPLVSENIANFSDVITSRNTAIYPHTILMSENTAEYPDIVSSRNTEIYPDTLLMSVNKANSTDIVSSGNSIIFPNIITMSENRANSSGISTSRDIPICQDTSAYQNTPITLGTSPFEHSMNDSSDRFFWARTLPSAEVVALSEPDDLIMTTETNIITYKDNPTFNHKYFYDMALSDQPGPQGENSGANSEPLLRVPTKAVIAGNSFSDTLPYQPISTAKFENISINKANISALNKADMELPSFDSHIPTYISNNWLEKSTTTTSADMSLTQLPDTIIATDLNIMNYENIPTDDLSRVTNITNVTENIFPFDEEFNHEISYLLNADNKNNSDAIIEKSRSNLSSNGGFDKYAHAVNRNVGKYRSSECIKKENSSDEKLLVPTRIDKSLMKDDWLVADTISPVETMPSFGHANGIFTTENKTTFDLTPSVNEYGENAPLSYKTESQDKIIKVPGETFQISPEKKVVAVTMGDNIMSKSNDEYNDFLNDSEANINKNDDSISINYILNKNNASLRFSSLNHEQDGYMINGHTTGETNEKHAANNERLNKGTLLSSEDILESVDAYDILTTENNYKTFEEVTSTSNGYAPDILQSDRLRHTKLHGEDFFTTSNIRTLEGTYTDSYGLTNPVVPINQPDSLDSLTAVHEKELSRNENILPIENLLKFPLHHSNLNADHEYNVNNSEGTFAKVNITSSYKGLRSDIPSLDPSIQNYNANFANVRPKNISDDWVEEESALSDEAHVLPVHVHDTTTTENTFGERTSKKDLTSLQFVNKTKMDIFPNERLSKNNLYISNENKTRSDTTFERSNYVNLNIEGFLMGAPSAGVNSQNQEIGDCNTKYDINEKYFSNNEIVEGREGQSAKVIKLPSQGKDNVTTEASISIETPSIIPGSATDLPIIDLPITDLPITDQPFHFTGIQDETVFTPEKDDYRELSYLSNANDYETITDNSEDKINRSYDTFSNSMFHERYDNMLNFEMLRKYLGNNERTPISEQAVKLFEHDDIASANENNINAYGEIHSDGNRYFKDIITSEPKQETFFPTSENSFTVSDGVNHDLLSSRQTKSKEAFDNIEAQVKFENVLSRRNKLDKSVDSTLITSNEKMCGKTLDTGNRLEGRISISGKSMSLTGPDEDTSTTENNIKTFEKTLSVGEKIKLAHGKKGTNIVTIDNPTHITPISTNKFVEGFPMPYLTELGSGSMPRSKNNNLDNINYVKSNFTSDDHLKNSPITDYPSVLNEDKPGRSEGINSTLKMVYEDSHPKDLNAVAKSKNVNVLPIQNSKDKLIITDKINECAYLTSQGYFAKNIRNEASYGENGKTVLTHKRLDKNLPLSDQIVLESESNDRRVDCSTENKKYHSDSQSSAEGLILLDQAFSKPIPTKALKEELSLSDQRTLEDSLEHRGTNAKVLGKIPFSYGEFDNEDVPSDQNTQKMEKIHSPWENKPVQITLQSDQNNLEHEILMHSIAFPQKRLDKHNESELEIINPRFETAIPESLKDTSSLKFVESVGAISKVKVKHRKTQSFGLNEVRNLNKQTKELDTKEKELSNKHYEISNFDLSGKDHETSRTGDKEKVHEYLRGSVLGNISTNVMRSKTNDETILHQNENNILPGNTEIENVHMQGRPFVNKIRPDFIIADMTQPNFPYLRRNYGKQNPFKSRITDENKLSGKASPLLLAILGRDRGSEQKSVKKVSVPLLYLAVPQRKVTRQVKPRYEYLDSYKSRQSEKNTINSRSLLTNHGQNIGHFNSGMHLRENRLIKEDKRCQCNNINPESNFKLPNIEKPINKMKRDYIPNNLPFALNEKYIVDFSKPGVGNVDHKKLRHSYLDWQKIKLAISHDKVKQCNCMDGRTATSDEYETDTMYEESQFEERKEMLHSGEAPEEQDVDPVGILGEKLDMNFDPINTSTSEESHSEESAGLIRGPINTSPSKEVISDETLGLNQDPMNTSGSEESQSEETLGLNRGPINTSPSTEDNADETLGLNQDPMNTSVSEESQSEETLGLNRGPINTSPSRKDNSDETLGLNRDPMNTSASEESESEETTGLNRNIMNTSSSEEVNSNEMLGLNRDPMSTSATEESQSEEIIGLNRDLMNTSPSEELISDETLGLNRDPILTLTSDDILPEDSLKDKGNFGKYEAPGKHFSSSISKFLINPQRTPLPESTKTEQNIRVGDHITRWQSPSSFNSQTYYQNPGFSYYLAVPNVIYGHA